MAALAAMVGLSVNAQLTSGEVYWIQDTSTGQFISGGANWGTRSTMKDVGGLGFEATQVSDGVYTLKNVMLNLVHNLSKGLGSDLFIDNGTPASWTITAVTGGYTINNGDTYLCNNGEANSLGVKPLGSTSDAAAATVWRFLTKTEYDAAIQAYKDAKAASIATALEITASTVAELEAILTDDTKFTATDMTSAINNPTIGSSWSGWTHGGTPNSNRGEGANVGSGCAEFWNGCGYAKQTVSGLVNGVYKIQFAGTYRPGNSGPAENVPSEKTSSPAFAYANNEKVELVHWIDVAAKANSRQGIYDNKAAYTNTIYTYVSDGTLELGVVSDYWNNDNNYQWCPFGQFTLTYYLDNSASIVVPESIELSKTSANLTTGSVLQLTETISPADALDKSVTWSSNDESVATVSNGVVMARKPGTATITVTSVASPTVTTSCTVTVADAPAPTYYSEIAEGDFYIVNAATGQFLGGGNSWGTQASLIEHGIPFTAALSDGGYTLDSHTYNNATDHFVNGTYVDGGATKLYITSVGNGRYTISTADGSAFMIAQAGTTIVDNSGADATSTLAQWYFLSKKDRDKMLTAATTENPADATYYIKQANISRNLSAGAQGENAWSYLSTGGTQENSNYVAQVWNGNVNIEQVITGIPNGTYTLTMQGFTSGTDVKLFANEEEVAVRPNDSGKASCADASVLFAAKSYPNTLTVTVTDRTLTIGLRGDCTSGMWLCYDDFELSMTGYTANTAVDASIDKAEIEAGQTAQITAATVPANASFNAITYSSDDESVATVNENGVVTGMGIGTATITVAANEMESFSKTIDVTVTAVTPTALAIYNGEDEVTEPVALDQENTEVTLTVVPTPTDANASVTWESSDPTVATVAGGVVTAVSTGTATITATSTIDAEVKAEATINVSFPETEVGSEGYINDGAARTVYTYGANLIKNGTFEYPDGFYGWTDATAGAAQLSSSKFEIVTDGENKYLKAKASEGSTAAGSIGTAWSIESGKTYVFGYRVKAYQTIGDKSAYHKVTLTNTPGTETLQISDNNTPVTNAWNDVKYTFTNTDGYAYVQIRARWLANDMSFDDFYLVEVESEETVGNVEYATAAIPTANIGTEAFQFSQDAIDAANNLVQGEASVADVESVYAALTTINEPAADQLFNVVLTYGGWTYDQKAMTYIANGRTDAGNYNIQYKEAANKNLAQAFTFTKVSGNNYKMSQIDADGNARYLSTGVPYGGNTGQIRTTTEAGNALVVTVIPTATEGVWNLKNTEANQYIGSQDAGVFTVNSHIDFNIVETEKPVITVNTTVAGYGTLMLPFVATLPEGMKAYTCSEVDGEMLTLTEVDVLEANKPYILEGTMNEDLTGDAQGTALTYTEGLLTGVYEEQLAPVGKFVLQKNDEKVGFYKVAEGKQPTMGANRAYLTEPASVEARDAYFFFGEAGTTGISTIDAVKALTGGNARIFNAAGVEQSGLQKGLNIVKKADGTSFKVMVK